MNQIQSEEYIENILRLNKGKEATFYMNFDNSEYGSKIFKGIIEAANKGHFIISDKTGKRYLLLLIFINYITIEGDIAYEYPYANRNSSSPFKVRNQPPAVSAQSAILFDGNNSNIIFEKNAYTPLPIASLTKVMTAIVAIESANLDSQVTISQEAASQSPSSCPLTAGDTLTLRDLLYCLLLRSGNDAAWAIAEYVAGNVPAFVKLMNQKAKSLGLTQTTFSNPSGLDVPSSNISTAYDFAKLMQYAMSNADFRKIAGAKTYNTTSKFGTNYAFVHKHRLLNNVDYVTAGKTGFTRKAGRTLVTTAEKQGQQFIVVTLNDPNDWQDHINLFEYGFGLYGINVNTPADFLKQPEPEFD